jgi:hypothetical protein
VSKPHDESGDVDDDFDGIGGAVAGIDVDLQKTPPVLSL